MSHTAMNGRRVLEPISKAAVKKFCQDNKVMVKELAEISGYASDAAFSRAVSNGYIQAEALSNLYQFFDLPKGYFNGVQIATEDVVPEEAPEETVEVRSINLEGAELPKVTVIDTETANKLLRFYGDVDYEALFVRLLWADYERNKEAIARKKYEGMTTEELIAELVRRDTEAV